MPIRPVRKIAAEHPAEPPAIQARIRVRASAPSPGATPSPPATPSPASTLAPPIAAVSAPPSPDDDKVGYCRPPKASQFKPGQSGNPKGRPRGARGLNTIVIEKMTQKLPVRTASGRKKMAKVEVMVQQSVDAALGGNERERAKMLDRYSAAVPEEPIIVPDALLASHDGPAMSPEELPLNLAMLDQLRSILAAQAGGAA